MFSCLLNILISLFCPEPVPGKGNNLFANTKWKSRLSLAKEEEKFNMKNITSTGTFLIILLIISCSAWSQTTLRFGVGYMFPLDEGELNPYLNSMTYNPSIMPEVHNSWGNGGAFGATIDHQFDKYVDLEFGARYRYGASINYNDTISGLTNVANDHLRMFVFSLGADYDFNYSTTFVPYIGTGVNVGVDDKVINTETSSDVFGNTTAFNSKLTCAPVFGGYFELGTKYSLTSTCFFFIELRFDFLSLTPQNLYYNTVTQNGSDITNTLLPYQQQINYVKNVSTYTFSQLQPEEAIAQSIAASSWGFNVGIAFKIKSATKASSKKQ
jgi:hypothetical protein